MSIRIKGLFDAKFIHAITRMTVATIFMGVITYISVLLFQFNANDQSFLTTFPKFFIIVAISLSVYILFSRILKLYEASMVTKRIQAILFSRIN